MGRGLLISLFPLPQFLGPPFISAVSTDLVPLETSASPFSSPPGQPPLDLPSSPSLWPHCLAKAGPPGWNRWTETRAWGRLGGGRGRLSQPVPGKGSGFGKNKTEGGAWEKVAGEGPEWNGGGPGGGPHASSKPALTLAGSAGPGGHRLPDGFQVDPADPPPAAAAGWGEWPFMGWEWRGA